jgi:hypothetical protein
MEAEDVKLWSLLAMKICLSSSFWSPVEAVTDVGDSKPFFVHLFYDCVKHHVVPESSAGGSSIFYISEIIIKVYIQTVVGLTRGLIVYWYAEPLKPQEFDFHSLGSSCRNIPLRT